MKALFEKLQKLGYTVHNKRVLGKPDYTSAETKQADLIQEFALVVFWIDQKYGFWVKIFNASKEGKKGFIWSISNHFSQADWTIYDSPEKALGAGIEHVLNNLL